MIVSSSAGTWWAGALALSVVALALRGIGPWSWVVAACGGALAVAAPFATGARLPSGVWWAATIAGLPAFVIVRMLWSSPTRVTSLALVAAVVAAVGEEALFRRGVYGFLERWGAAVAVVGAALAFGLVHAPIYGWRVVPLDVGAGLVFGWQRWVTRRWSSPAVTHAVANVLAHV